ncbi:hypothetical protein HYPP_01494 [Hyphomicrobium sp. ghe19]|nr:hypothetical protein HYPP_01494 [Hyphomicrobium sp. ghe19]
MTAFRNGTVPSIENLQKVARAVRLELSNLFQDEKKQSITLEVVYEILGGEMWAPARHASREFPLSVLDEDLVSLEVTTDQYRSRGYRLGDILSGPKQSRNFHNLIGLDCIVESKDGKRYFKILGKRDAKGNYTLRSFEPEGEELSGVELKWIAPIKMIFRN